MKVSPDYMKEVVKNVNLYNRNNQQLLTHGNNLARLFMLFDSALGKDYLYYITRITNLIHTVYWYNIEKEDSTKNITKYTKGNSPVLMTKAEMMVELFRGSPAVIYYADDTMTILKCYST